MNIVGCVLLLYPVTLPPAAPCRYASLYFCSALEDPDNELLALEVMHRYVELLDKYFGNVRARRSGCREEGEGGGLKPGHSHDMSFLFTADCRLVQEPGRGPIGNRFMDVFLS